MKVCTFFGRRNVFCKDKIYNLLKTEVEKSINQGYTIFYNGLCGDFDLLALNAVYELKKTYPHIKSYVIKSYIKDTNIELRYRLKYDSTIYPDIESIPPKFCIIERNKWMAKKCDKAITYVDVNWGGSYLGYALVEKLNKPLVNLGQFKI